MQLLVLEHFSSNDHSGFLEEFSVTVIDEAGGSDPTRKEYWKRTGWTG